MSHFGCVCVGEWSGKDRLILIEFIFINYEWVWSALFWVSVLRANVEWRFVVSSACRQNLGKLTLLATRQCQVTWFKSTPTSMLLWFDHSCEKYISYKKDKSICKCPSVSGVISWCLGIAPLTLTRVSARVFLAFVEVSLKAITCGVPKGFFRGFVIFPRGLTFGVL